MEVYGKIRQKVEINPIDVINKLIENEIGFHGWIFNDNDKYYQGYEQSAGLHSFDEKKEISKEKFDYVLSLQNCLTYLKK